MKPSPSLYVLGLTAVCDAFKFRVSGRMNKDLSDLERRGNVAGSSPLKNSADITYFANVSLGGTDFEALIDTGSGDLWVAAHPEEIKGAKDSGKTSGVNYAIGAVNGPIKFADFQFAGFSVPDQAYLEITPDEGHSQGRGLIGLGPATGSNIYRDLGKTTAASPVLDRIFLQNLSTPNFLTVNLGRFEDPTDIFQGDMSIGTYLEGYEAIKNTPKLPVSIVPVRRSGDQHFTILLDADGWIGPDGKALPARTEVEGNKNEKRLVSVVDTGFSLTQVPRYIADGIYSRYDGAEFKNVSGIGPTWIVPCDQEVNMTLTFSGVKYPIHPMDATLNPTLLNMDSIVNSAGQRSCIGSFQPMVFNRGKSPSYDVILGMSFIRNVYALFDFGDFVHGPEDRGDPYIQMLSTTDPAEAHSDFVTVRLEGIDKTGFQRLNSAKTDGPPPKKTETKTIIYFALAVTAVALAVIIGIVSLVIMIRRRRRNSAGVYKPLHDPASASMQTAGAGPMLSAPSANNPAYNQHQYYNTPYASQTLYDPVPNPAMNQNSQYPSPWDPPKPHH